MKTPPTPIAPTVIPKGKRIGIDGLDGWITVRDWDGGSFQTKVEPVEHRPIPTEWDKLSWFIVSTITKPQPPSLPRLDQLAMVEIMAQGFPVVMPVANRRVRERLANGKTGKNLVDMPKLLLPGYVLVGMGDNYLANINSVMRVISQCRHVGGFVTQGDKPVWLPREAVKRFFTGLNNGIYNESPSNLKALDSPVLGKLARITDGPMELITGIVKEFVVKGTPDEPVYTHAFVEVDVFGCKRPVKVPIDSLKRVD